MATSSPLASAAAALAPGGRSTSSPTSLAALGRCAKRVLARLVIFATAGVLEALKHERRLSLRVARAVLDIGVHTAKIRQRLGTFAGACLLGCALAVTRCPPRSVRDVGAGRMRRRRAAAGVGAASCRSRDGAASAERPLPLLVVAPALLASYPDLQIVSGHGGRPRRYHTGRDGPGTRRRGLMPGALCPGCSTSCIVLLRLRRPSTQEGFGLVYLEAMNYAKPCIGCFDQDRRCHRRRANRALVTTDRRSGCYGRGSQFRRPGEPPRGRRGSRPAGAFTHRFQHRLAWRADREVV